MFVSGFLGGIGHCIGMCGPIVTTYCLAASVNTSMPHILYNLGRSATYSIIGEIMGITGSFAGSIRFIENFQNIVLALSCLACAIHLFDKNKNEIVKVKAV